MAAVRTRWQDARDLAQRPRRAEFLFGHRGQRDRIAELHDGVAAVHDRVEEAPHAPADLPRLGEKDLGDARFLVRRAPDQDGDGHQLDVVDAVLADVFNKTL